MSEAFEGKEGVCAFCDTGHYGGTLAFRGVNVTEQTIALDLCENHWERLWRDLTRNGWIPNTDDRVRLVRLYEENGFSRDVVGQTVSIDELMREETPQRYFDEMKLLGYVSIGGHMYHPKRKAVRIEGRFTQQDYSAAKEAWMEDHELNEHRFPFGPVGGDTEGVKDIEMINGWVIEMGEEE